MADKLSDSWWFWLLVAAMVISMIVGAAILAIPIGCRIDQGMCP